MADTYVLVIRLRSNPKRSSSVICASVARAFSCAASGGTP